MRLVFGMPGKARGNRRHIDAIAWGIIAYGGLLVSRVLGTDPKSSYMGGKWFPTETSPFIFYFILRQNLSCSGWP